ncbi:peptidase M48, partial [Gracilibacillus oryzae]
MKKLIIGYLFFATAVFLYFYYFYPLDSFSDSRYGALSHAFYFAMLPLQIILLYVLLKKKGGYQWIEKYNSRLFQSFLFTCLLVILDLLVHLPFQIIWHFISRYEGTRTQSFLSWFLELLLSKSLLFLGLFLLIYFCCVLMEKWPKRWGILLWITIVPVAIFFVFIQPVWIDPLFDKFYTLENGGLRTEMEQLTESVGLTDVDFLVVNKSEEVTTYNAYVTGIFGHARI